MLRVDTSYIFAIIILLFTFVNVSIHASTLSLYTYIHALIQAQRIILLLYIAQPYRLRIYFKSYGSRSPVIRNLLASSSRPYRPYYTLTRTLTATHSAVKAAVTYSSIYTSRSSIPQGYTCSTQATWLPHVRHMASTQPLCTHLPVLQVSRLITAHTWPPHGLSTWYTPIN